MSMTSFELPLPPHYAREQVAGIWRVPYEARAQEAASWARAHDITPASKDRLRTLFIAIDVQNTFCIPDFELFVAGQSGRGAVEDNQRLCEFIYRNLAHLTHITATLDTHQTYQVFHANFLVNSAGAHPPPYSTITTEDIKRGRWKFNTAVAGSLGVDPAYGESLLAYYTDQLERTGKFALTIWPYHAMLGGIGHALVASVEEAIFFHSIARADQPTMLVKGRNAFTEHYSAIGPEVLEGPDGGPIGETNADFLQSLRAFDRVIIAGQAKSHCVAWTISDILLDIMQTGTDFANKVYLLDDCTSPVVVPGADYTAQAETAFERFAAAGMHRVRSTDPIRTWPGIP